MTEADQMREMMDGVEDTKLKTAMIEAYFSVEFIDDGSDLKEQALGAYKMNGGQPVNARVLRIETAEEE